MVVKALVIVWSKSDIDMKKLFTLLLLTAVAAGSANSQIRMGILGGPQSSSLIEKNDIPGWDADTKPFYLKRSGFHVGLIVEMPIGESNRWFLQPGFLYQAKGNRFQQVFDTTVTHSDTLSLNNNFYINYIEMPFNIAYKIPLGKKSNFLLSAGPYLSFFYNGKRTMESRVAEGATLNFKKDESNVEAGDAENKVTTFDFGANARVGFELGNVLLTGYISQGLTSFYKAPYNGTFKHQVIGASIGFWLSKRTPVTPKDTDNDGVPDKEDLCKDIAGVLALKGCPDKDGDGITDAADKCPDVAGLLKYNGCPIPDKDNDGINDEEDKCPDVKGVAKYNGCPVPDTDGDGLNDESDSCPDKPGTVEFNGCPIPDSDGDGLNDKEDKCPTEAGKPENKGCPEIKQEIVEKVNFAARNIFFGLNSDKINTGSYDDLDEVAKVLKENPALVLAVEGHSDNTGKAALNLSLSQKRADAVKKYLVEKGINENRLQATGFGQEKPIASNATEAGRAKNRRVELKLSH